MRFHLKYNLTAHWEANMAYTKTILIFFHSPFSLRGNLIWLQMLLLKLDVGLLRQRGNYGGLYWQMLYRLNISTRLCSRKADYWGAGEGLELLYYARNHWSWYFADKYCSDCDNEAPAAVVTASEPEPETEAGCQSHSVSLSLEPSEETQSGPSVGNTLYIFQQVKFCTKDIWSESQHRDKSGNVLSHELKSDGRVSFWVVLSDRV